MLRSSQNRSPLSPLPLYPSAKNNRAFGKGVPDKAFHIEVPRGIPFEFCKQKGTYLGTWGRYPMQAPFVTLLFPNALMFGKGVSSRSSLGCSLSVSEAKRNVPGNTRHVPPKTPFLKLLFRTPEQSRVGPFSRNSREFRDFRDCRDSSSEKNPFEMTPFSGLETRCPTVLSALLKFRFRICSESPCPSFPWFS